MSNVRALLAVAVVAFLALTYLASQYAYLYGDAAAYAKAVDTPPMKTLSLVLLVVALVLAILPDREGRQA